MSDDRLDDAIDAVVRAVDRIERATRAPGLEAAVTQAPPTVTGYQAQPTRPAQPSGPLSDATRPIQGSVGATGAFWSPRPGQSPYDAPIPPAAPAQPGPGQSFTGQTGQSEWSGQPGPDRPSPETTAEFSALGAATVRAAGEHAASAEVHELVGRIVGRMQTLEDHLGAASQLRGEISELVARLAAAAATQR